MKISINRDIEEAYKENFMKGFSMRECLYILLSLGIIVGVAALLWYVFGLPLNVSAYVGIPFGIPTLIIGFKKFQGLTLTEYIKELIYEHKIRELCYDADELPENMEFSYSMKLENKESDRRKSR